MTKFQGMTTIELIDYVLEALKIVKAGLGSSELHDLLVDEASEAESYLRDKGIIEGDLTTDALIEKLDEVYDTLTE